MTAAAHRTSKRKLRSDLPPGLSAHLVDTFESLNAIGRVLARYSLKLKPKDAEDFGWLAGQVRREAGRGLEMARQAKR